MNSLVIDSAKAINLRAFHMLFRRLQKHSAKTFRLKKYT